MPTILARLDAEAADALFTVARVAGVPGVPGVSPTITPSGSFPTNRCSAGGACDGSGDGKHGSDIVGMYSIGREPM